MKAKSMWLGPIVVALVAALASAQDTTSPVGDEERAKDIAARRAERDANRLERLPSRPVTVRGPLPLPVQAAPVGGKAVAKSCSAEPCSVEYRVPSGATLVVTALWNAENIRCDTQMLGKTPGGGQSIAPWWHCSSSLTFGGKGAGFTGFLHTHRE